MKSCFYIPGCGKSQNRTSVHRSFDYKDAHNVNTSPTQEPPCRAWGVAQTPGLLIVSATPQISSFHSVQETSKAFEWQQGWALPLEHCQVFLPLSCPSPCPFGHWIPNWPVILGHCVSCQSSLLPTLTSQGQKPYRLSPSQESKPRAEHRVVSLDTLAGRASSPCMADLGFPEDAPRLLRLGCPWASGGNRK